MPIPLEQILEQRRQRESAGQRRRTVAVSIFSHSLVVALAWFVPDLLAKPPEPFNYVAVTVVPPSVLGQKDPPPPPPPVVKEEEKPEVKPEVAPPPPKPEPDVMVLPEKKKVTETPPPPSPPPPQAPPPPTRQPPPKRQGSPFGSSLGATHRDATIGVEDPNFTYGYYLDRVVSVIGQQWKRPLVDPSIVQATFYFRISGDGTLTDLRLVTSSGSQSFDQTAEKAVRAASPFPPLPKQYTKKFGRDYLGIHLIIK